MGNTSINTSLIQRDISFSNPNPENCTVGSSIKFSTFKGEKGTSNISPVSEVYKISPMFTGFFVDNETYTLIKLDSKYALKFYKPTSTNPSAYCIPSIYDVTYDTSYRDFTNVLPDGFKAAIKAYVLLGSMATTQPVKSKSFAFSYTGAISETKNVSGVFKFQISFTSIYTTNTITD